MLSLTCPRCAPAALDPAPDGPLRAWACGQCGGHALTVSALRQSTSKARFAALWGATLTQARPGPTPCPSCRVEMRTVAAPAATGPVRIDLCRPCQLFWFDLGERDAVAGSDARAARVAAPGDRHAALSLDARRLLAQEQLRLDRERRRLEGAGDRWHDRWLVGDVVVGLIELLAAATH